MRHGSEAVQHPFYDGHQSSTLTVRFGRPGLKTVRSLFVTLSVLALLGVGATPAFAVGTVGAGTPKPWHYWIAPILGISFVGIFIAIMIGYYVKVFRPKYRGR